VLNSERDIEQATITIVPFNQSMIIMWRNFFNGKKKEKKRKRTAKRDRSLAPECFGGGGGEWSLIVSVDGSCCHFASFFFYVNN